MTTRKALIVGINAYEHVPSLYGCVDDALAVQQVLERHGDGQLNFDCHVLLARHAGDQVTRGMLKDKLAELFDDSQESALFYFAGHGFLDETGGYLLTSECERGDAGLSLQAVVKLANDSKARNRIILLDSCHSGVAADSPSLDGMAQLKVGMSVLTASTATQYATEANGHGLFTGLLVSALEGGAANLAGDISPGSVYAYIDQSLGSWVRQRPMFKANVREFVSLRRVPAPISLQDLQKITALFPTPDHVFKLSPEFEPEMKGRDEGMPPPDPQKVEKFKVLQRYNRLNLLVPVDAPHMWHAAMNYKACQLTALGQHYHRLVANKRL